MIIDEKGHYNARRVQVQCDCGVTKWLRPWNLRSGHSLSCGCLRRERATRQGQSRTRLYRCWYQMIQRCLHPNNSRFRFYGGRGIRVNPEWQDFSIFAKWAQDNGHQDHLTLDRKDTNGDYEPSNCRWASRSQQAHSRRKLPNNTSGYIGVSWSTSHGKYSASARQNNRSVNLGYFDDPEEAARVRDAFVKQHYDKHVTLNFPEETSENP